MKLTEREKIIIAEALEALFHNLGSKAITASYNGYNQVAAPLQEKMFEIFTLKTKFALKDRDEQ